MFLKNSYAPFVPYTIVNENGEIVSAGFADYQSLEYKKTNESDKIYIGFVDPRNYYVDVNNDEAKAKQPFTSFENLPPDAEIYPVDEVTKMVKLSDTEKVKDISKFVGKQVYVKSKYMIETIVVVPENVKPSKE